MAPHLASLHENLDSIPRIRKQEEQKIMEEGEERRRGEAGIEKRKAGER